jgi:hypothetical protein
MDYEKRSYITLKIHDVMKWWHLFLVFLIWFFKWYNLIKYIYFKIFNQILTHIILNLKGTLIEIALMTPKNGLSSGQPPYNYQPFFLYNLG